MKHFYNPQTNSFYIDEITPKIPDGCVEITEQQHNELYNAINSGCIIFEDLTYSLPKPSLFHKWDSENKKWVLDKAEQRSFIIKQNEMQRDLLLDSVNSEIDILNRAVRLRRASAADKKRLEILESYTVDLYELDLNDVNVVFPEKPE